MNTPYDLQSSDKELDIYHFYSESDVYFYPYARYALLQGLKLLNLEKNDTVYLPAFICRDILAPINHLVLRPVFYDVDKQLNGMLDNSLKTKVVIAVNYFGFAQDLGPYKTYCSIHNAYLIEDNAHGFLSRDHQGKLLGTRGEIGLLSIRKTVFLPNGAALLINNKEIPLKIDSPVIKQSSDDVKFQKKIKLKKIINSPTVKLGTWVLLFRRLVRKIKTGDIFPLPDPESENELPVVNTLTPVLEKGILKIDTDKEKARRIRMYNLIHQYINKFNISPVFKSLDKHTVPYVFPFYAEKKEKNRFEKFLLAKNFFVIPWPDLPDDISGSSKEHYNKLWMVPFLW